LLTTLAPVPLPYFLIAEPEFFIGEEKEKEGEHH
jgi:hypothetical protein